MKDYEHSTTATIPTPNEEKVNKAYECSVCGNTHVKLWRPYMATAPLICASCAEARQTPYEYNECIWEKVADGYVGHHTGRKLPLPKWEVASNGKIPAYHDPGPKGLPMEMTDQLIIDLKDVSKSYSSGRTNMVPAVPDEEGNFWGYTSVPEERCKWWEELPTK